jgi:hypothetical protein
MWIKVFGTPLERTHGQQVEGNRAGRLQQRQRVKLSAEAALQRMQVFGKRREQFIAAI